MEVRPAAEQPTGMPELKAGQMVWVQETPRCPGGKWLWLGLHLEQCPQQVGEMLVSEVSRPGLESQVCSVWPWAGCFNSLSLGFLIYKMGVIVSTYRVDVKIENNDVKHLTGCL